MASFLSPPASGPFSQRPNSSPASSETRGPKKIENPFLVQGTPVARTNKNDNPLGSPNLFSPRSPAALNPIPENGLRNRKSIQKTAVEPPKTSVYLSAGGSFGSALGSGAKENNTPARSDFFGESSSNVGGNWILVYGYTNYEQYRALLEKFSSYGRVLKHKKPSTLVSDSSGCSHQNWLALQYESRLEAEKALCHDHCQLDNGVFCGVKRLNDNDPLLMYEGGEEGHPRYIGDQQGLIAVASHVADDEDVDLTDGRIQSVCEKFFRWVLSIH